MRRLNKIIRKGNRKRPPLDNSIRCRDGFTFSVIAGYGTYCRPRPAFCMNDEIGIMQRYEKGCGKCQPDGYFDDAHCAYRGPYTHLEVGFPSLTPEPWEDWEPYWDGGDHPTGSVYGYVPVELIRRLIIKHGGEKIHQVGYRKHKKRVAAMWP